MFEIQQIHGKGRGIHGFDQRKGTYLCRCSRSLRKGLVDVKQEKWSGRLPSRLQLPKGESIRRCHRRGEGHFEDLSRLPQGAL